MEASKKKLVVTDDLYQRWLVDPTTNPLTGRKIKLAGPVYNVFKKYQIENTHSGPASYTPKPHQTASTSELVKKMTEGNFVWYCDEIGSGKTFAVISAIAEILASGKRPPSRIVLCVGCNTFHQWRQSLTLFPDIDVFIAKNCWDVRSGGYDEKKVILCMPGQAVYFMALNRNTLLVVDEHETYRKLAKTPGISRIVHSIDRVLYISATHAPDFYEDESRLRLLFRKCFHATLEKLQEATPIITGRSLQLREYQQAFTTQYIDCVKVQSKVERRNYKVEYVKHTVRLTTYTKLVQEIVDRALVGNDLTEETERVRKSLKKKGIECDKFADIVVMKRIFDMKVIEDMEAKEGFATDVSLQKRVAEKKAKWERFDLEYKRIKEEFKECNICCQSIDVPTIFPCCQYVVCNPCSKKLPGCPQRCQNTKSMTLREINERHCMLNGGEKNTEDTVLSLVEKIFRTTTKCLWYNPSFYRELSTDKIGKRCAFLYKNETTTMKERAIYEYNHGDTVILAIHNVTDISGMNLQMTTDIVIIESNRVTPEDVKQVIGRALREGRPEDLALTVHTITVI